MTGLAPIAVAAVLFDFGHTLFTHIPGPVIVKAEAARLGHPLTASGATELWGEIEAAAQHPAEVARGRDLDAAVWRARWRILYGIADRVHPGLGDALHRSFHDPWAWFPYAETADVLAALARAGVPAGVVSNTGWDVRAPFVVRGLDRLVTSFTLSCEAGAAKPDPAIFHAACRSLGVPPARVLMVGDDPVADAGAATAGLAGVVLVDRSRPVTTRRALAAAVAPLLTSR